MDGKGEFPMRFFTSDVSEGTFDCDGTRCAVPRRRGECTEISEVNGGATLIRWNQWLDKNAAHSGSALSVRTPAKVWAMKARRAVGYGESQIDGSNGQASGLANRTGLSMPLDEREE